VKQAVLQAAYKSVCNYPQRNAKKWKYYSFFLRYVKIRRILRQHHPRQEEVEMLGTWR